MKLDDHWEVSAYITSATEHPWLPVVQNFVLRVQTHERLLNPKIIALCLHHLKFLYHHNHHDVLQPTQEQLDTQTTIFATPINPIITNLNNLYTSLSKGLQSYFKTAYNDVLNYVESNDLASAIELVQTYPLPNATYQTEVNQILAILGVTSES